MIIYRNLGIVALLMVILVLPGVVRADKATPRETYPPHLVGAWIDFLDALDEERWTDALQNASPRVRGRMAQYDSPETFIRDVVPVAELKELYSRNQPFLGYGIGRHADGRKYGLTNVELIDSKGRRHPWNFQLNETTGSVELDIPIMPLSRYLQVSSQYRSEYEQYTSRTQALAAQRLRDVSFRIETDKTRYAPGEKVMTRIVFVNPTKYEAWISGHSSLIHYYARHIKVIGPDGQKTARIPPPVTGIGVGASTIPPKSESPLFDWTDLTTAYDIQEPGEYRIEFTDARLDFGINLNPEDSQAPTYPEELKSEPLLSIYRFGGIIFQTGVPPDFVPRYEECTFRISAE